MKTLEWRDGTLHLIDQTKLPLDVVDVSCRTYLDVAEAIETMKIRGAPAIGLAAAYGMALAARGAAMKQRHEALAAIEEAGDRLGATRPTAVNLFWAIDRMRRLVSALGDVRSPVLAEALVAEADLMMAEDEAANRQMGVLGAALIPHAANILTHCNAGALATGSYGTALGVIRAAHEAGKRIHVWVDETRPLLQGARLTAWELQEAGIPFTLITDNMAGHFMARGAIDAVITGADRIAANGDTANKIGTYSVAVLAGAHGLPFYVAAPVSTIDVTLASGQDIPIEERNPDEVEGFRETRSAPRGVRVANPAFDVTPARLISAIITDRGVVRDPYAAGIAAVAQGGDVELAQVEK